MIPTKPTTIFATTLRRTRGIALVLAFALVAVLGMTLWIGIADAAPTTFTVTNTSGSGEGSLRETIADANSNANPTDQDTIEFDIQSGCDATSGVCTIAPTTALPEITEAAIIDGYTQSGASPNTLSTGNDAELKIELDGTSAGNVSGLRITAPNSVVKGLIINRWSSDGVLVLGPEASGNRIEGNFIGTDASGTQPLDNVSDGVQIEDAPNNVVGGTSAAARNIVSANNNYGIQVDGTGASGNRIEGNFIGTDASGQGDLGNNFDGVQIDDAPNNVVGGTTATARNIISGNDDRGIRLVNSDASGNRIQGNYIGTDASGTQDLGNEQEGVEIRSSTDNVVGGTSAAARNIISANGFEGVEISGGSSTDNEIIGNYIGTNASGTQDLGNDREGVSIFQASNNVVGGTSAGASNTIANNGEEGVSIFADEATGNSVLRNSIFDNEELGIDLNGGTENASGVTANDPQDPDPGPNNLQNYPIITSATTPNGRSVSVQGTLNSNPNEAFTIEFFSSPEADPSGYGEGKTYLGQTNIITNAGGNATFSFSANTPVLAGEFVTATATNSVTGDTSEFSEALEVEDTTRPTVVSSKPPDGASGVLPATNVSVIFSEQMQASTINENTFKLFERVGGTLEPVEATVSYNATFRRGVLNPDENLTRGARYVAKVTVGARDLAGNRLEETETIIFVVKE